jgi:hypothetical protein
MIDGPRARSGVGPDWFPGTFSIFLFFPPFVFILFFLFELICKLYFDSNLFQKILKTKPVQRLLKLDRFGTTMF